MEVNSFWVCKQPLTRVQIQTCIPGLGLHFLMNTWATLYGLSRCCPSAWGPGVKASGFQQTGPRWAHAVENIQTSFRACAFDFWDLSWYEQALDTALHGPHWPFLVMASTAYYLLACLSWVGRSDQKGHLGENKEQEDNSPSIPNAIMNYLGWTDVEKYQIF